MNCARPAQMRGGPSGWLVGRMRLAGHGEGKRAGER